MFQKPDLSQVWANVPSKDIQETRASRGAARQATSPLVHVGTVRGNVITINTASAIDLGALLEQTAKGPTA